jgi:hypothetical protein
MHYPTPGCIKTYDRQYSGSEYRWCDNGVLVVPTYERSLAAVAVVGFPRVVPLIVR